MEQSLKKYRSHKIVEAAKIYQVWDELLPVEEGGEVLVDGMSPVNPNYTKITFVDDPYGKGITFTNEQLLNRPEPEEGMYLVRYEDGYISFSPAKAFEDGYELIGAQYD